jgi:thymidylate synthase (FAD)
MRLVEPKVVLVSATPEPEKLIERMGRICYKSEDKITIDSAPKFIAMLLKRGHESVIEHAFAGVIVTTDRGISHEQVRHRLASYSQESTRYCNYGKGDFGGEIS